MKNLKVVTWTLFGIIAAVVLTSIVLIAVQKAIPLGIMFSLWAGIAVGIAVTELYHLWKKLRQPVETVDTLTETSKQQNETEALETTTVKEETKKKVVTSKKKK